jgi:hypothetical protein
VSEKLKQFYFKIMGMKYSFIIFIITCSILSFMYGDAIISYFPKIHWAVFIIYFVISVTLMEISFESKWLKNQSNFIKYGFNIITTIFCAPFCIIGLTLIFGSFIEVPLRIILTILSTVKIIVDLLVNILVQLVRH